MPDEMPAEEEIAVAEVVPVPETPEGVDEGPAAEALEPALEVEPEPEDEYVGVHGLLRELNPNYKIGDSLSAYELRTQGSAITHVSWAKDTA